jgi:hypothetical protein
MKYLKEVEYSYMHSHEENSETSYGSKIVYCASIDRVDVCVCVCVCVYACMCTYMYKKHLEGETPKY